MYSQCACTRFLQYSSLWGGIQVQPVCMSITGSSLTLVGNPAHVQPVCMYQVPPSLYQGWGIQHTYSQCACTRFLPYSGGESSTCTASVRVPGSSLTLVGNPMSLRGGIQHMSVCVYQVPPSLWWGIQHTYSQCACTRFLPHSGTASGNPAHVQPVCMYQVPPSLWWGIQHTYSQCACTRTLVGNPGTASVHVVWYLLTGLAHIPCSC